MSLSPFFLDNIIDERPRNLSLLSKHVSSTHPREFAVSVEVVSVFFPLDQTEEIIFYKILLNTMSE